MNKMKETAVCPHCKSSVPGLFFENGVIKNNNGIKIRAYVCGFCGKVVHNSTAELISVDFTKLK